MAKNKKDKVLTSDNIHEFRSMNQQKLTERNIRSIQASQMEVSGKEMSWNYHTGSFEKGNK